MSASAALTALATSRDLQLPDIHFPVIGNRWAVGTVFLLHIVFGSFTMGTLVLAPTYELIGRRRADLRFERYAKALGDVNVKIFSIGATFAGFAVMFLTFFYPRFFISLLEIFFWPALGAFLIWFPAIAALYTYAHSWERLGHGAHIALGYFAAAMDHVFLVLIVALDSFLLTPSAPGGLGAFFNASYFEELGHRFNGNISWASFFIAAVAAVYAGLRRAPEERAYFQWAARVSLLVGFLTLLLQVPLGALYVESVRHGSPGAFAYSFTGPFAWLWLVQVSLLVMLLVGSNLYFWFSRRRAASPVLTLLAVIAAAGALLPAGLYPRGLFWLRYVALSVVLAVSLTHWLVWRDGRHSPELRAGARAVLALTGVTAVALFLLMGVIRTTARGEYTVYGQLKEGSSYGIYDPGPGHYP